MIKVTELNMKPLKNGPVIMAGVAKKKPDSQTQILSRIRYYGVGFKIGKLNEEGKKNQIILVRSNF